MTYWVGPLVGACASLVLAVLVGRAAQPTKLKRAFTFLASMLVLWNLNFFTLYYVSDYSTAVFLTKIFRIGAVLVPPAVLYLIVSLSDQRRAVWHYVVSANFLISAILAITNLLDLMVVDLGRFGWGYYSVAGPTYDFFTLSVIFNFVGAICLVLHDYQTANDPRMRVQLKFWSLGAVLSIPLGFTNLLPSYGIPFYPLGSLGSAVFAGVVAYAIVRHRLMDIHLVVTRGMAYVAVSGVVIAPVFLLSLWLQHLSFGSIHPDFSFALLIMLGVVPIVFPYLRQRIEPRIERSWIRERRDYRLALLKFTSEVVRILERERLVSELVQTLGDALKLDRVAAFLGQKDNTVFTVHCASGVPPTTRELASNEPVFVSLLAHRGAVLIDELRASGVDIDRRAASLLDMNGWEVCIPLKTGAQLLGFIALGNKRDLEPFFAEDLELLDTLAAEASVGLENARLYEELKRSQDIIRRADRSSALGTLAAGIAHEIRNPLVSIQTFFQLAPSRINDQEFMTEFLDMTAQEVKRISHLINELLSFARSPTPSYGQIDLNQLVTNAVVLIAPEARKHGVRLATSLSDKTPLVYGDSEQIRQVLINLVFNAIQATPSGGSVAISTTRAQQDGMEVGRLEVRDTGCGIPPEALENIFNPFYTTKVKGTGLGLAIIQRIVSEHGGTVSVDTHVDAGSTFSVDLPTQEIGPANTSTASAFASSEVSQPRRAVS